MKSNETEDLKIEHSIGKSKNKSKEKRKKNGKKEKKQIEADAIQPAIEKKNVVEKEPTSDEKMKESTIADVNQEQLKEKKKKKRKNKRKHQDDKSDAQSGNPEGNSEQNQEKLPKNGKELKSSKKRKLVEEKSGQSDHKNIEEASNQPKQKKLRSEQMESKPSQKENVSTDDEKDLPKLDVKDKEDAPNEEETDIPDDKERLERTIFVGNVAQNATRKDIKKLFQHYGAIESVRIRNVIAVNPKIPKKVAFLTNRLAKFADSFSAYVVFKPQDDLELILKKACEEQNMVLFMEKHLRVMLALQSRRGPRRQSVFVGNLPFDCSEEELIEAFKPVAEEVGVKLTNVRVNRDRDTGVGRGVGFVSFDDDLGVQASLNSVGKISIRNRDVRVERAMKTKNMKSKSYKAKRNQHFTRSTG